MHTGRRHACSSTSSSVSRSHHLEHCHENAAAWRTHRVFSTGIAAAADAKSPDTGVHSTPNGLPSGSSHAADSGSGRPLHAPHEQPGGAAKPMVGNEEPRQASEEPDEAALEAACERMVLEAVRLLQEGQPEQAEYLISEGAPSHNISLPGSSIATPCRGMRQPAHVIFCLSAAVVCKLIQPDKSVRLHAKKPRLLDAHAGVKYVEGLLPDSASLASLLDQQALLQFLLDKLPEAEATARRLSGIATGIFGEQEPAAAMCSLRLGAVLAGVTRIGRVFVVLLLFSICHAPAQSPSHPARTYPAV